MKKGKRRALGQHFLKDARIARAIVEMAGPAPDDLVVEIGPGNGALTGLLAERAGRLLALEVDELLVGRLHSRFSGTGHVEIRLADARSFEYEKLPALLPSSAGRVLVVGNLPYSVSKPILFRLIEARAALSSLTLMLQREVAERVVASPGSRRYGSLSVLSQLYADPRLAFTVPPGAFTPSPEVESAVVQLTVLMEPRVQLEDEAAFRRVVKAGFGQRRKTLANALSGGLGIPVEAARRWLIASGIDPLRRAETLTLDEFACLSRQIPSGGSGAGGKIKRPC
jgi:16S rRNA (adenine1518-N6/adenine1519-N6)-dimethyltransferase